MRISDWSSDVCSSDLIQIQMVGRFIEQQHIGLAPGNQGQRQPRALAAGKTIDRFEGPIAREIPPTEEVAHVLRRRIRRQIRSEEHTSELQSLMRISYAVFCLKKKQNRPTTNIDTTHQHKQQ